MPRAICKTSSPCSISLRRFAACAIPIAALWICPALSHATGGGNYDEPPSSFFAPEIIDSPDELTFDHGEGSLPAELIEAVNRKEWSAYFRGKVSDANLSLLIYKMKLGELDKLIWAVEGKKSPAPVLSKESNAIKAELDGLGDKEQVLRALYYLGFAKRCEPIATRMLSEDAWDSAKVSAARDRDAATADKLLSASAGIAASMKDKFLLERYRFQRLRMMFYTSRHAEAQKYYAANIASFTTESSVKYRFMHTAAGSYRRDNKYGTANYLYSVVFDHFPPLKRTSYMSFRPAEEADWKECLSMAKSDRERAVMWQILGVANDGLAAIEKIYGSSPTSNLLQLLVVREVNKAEGEWFANEARKTDNLGSGAAEVRPEAAVVGKSRLSLLKRIADGKKAWKPALWQLAVGHLYILTGDIKSALSYLDQAEKSAPAGGSIAMQIRISRLFAKLRAMKAMDKSQEAWLAGELNWLNEGSRLRGPDLTGWTMERLQKFYKKGGDSLRATFLSGGLGAISDKELFPDNKRLDQILAFAARPDKSAFDDFLVRRYSVKKERIVEMKALNELYAGRWQSAADLLAQAGSELANKSLMADPFVIRNIDCHDCDHGAKKKTAYTRSSFIKKLIELSIQAQRTGREGAQASFVLANGLYNMTYFGNARDMYSFSGDYSSGPSLAPHCSMDLAEKYYKRAMELYGDKELKAKACFMAAKAEQNRYFNTHANGPDRPDAVHSPVYFKMLKASYADTRYYQEIIKECSYFRQYVGKK